MYLKKNCDCQSLNGLRPQQDKTTSCRFVEHLLVELSTSNSRQHWFQSNKCNKHACSVCIHFSSRYSLPSVNLYSWRSLRAKRWIFLSAPIMSMFNQFSTGSADQSICSVSRILTEKTRNMIIWRQFPLYLTCWFVCRQELKAVLSVSSVVVVLSATVLWVVVLMLEK